MRELRDLGVKVIGDHVHDGRRLLRLTWVVIDRVGPVGVDESGGLFEMINVAC